MQRTPIVVGNWKLNKTLGEATQLASELRNQLGSVRDVQIGVAPVFTALAAVAKRLEDRSIMTGAQNCYWESSGAFTGEVSPALLVDAGCSFVIVGHSERRAMFADTDEAVARKARSALDAGLHVIVCIGETESERDADKTMDVVGSQLSGSLANVSVDDLPRLLIAYEPVWAIGTGRTATPAQAQEVHAFIRKRLVERFGDAGSAIRVLYGGSVKPDNAESLLRQPDIDGALVGGASLQAADFAAIVKAARPERQD